MIADSTSLTKPKKDIVGYNTPGGRPIPVFRAQAWALEAAHNDGARFVVMSAIRTDSVIASFNSKYGENLHGQQYLYDHQNQPGFYPANSPLRTSHCGWQDGSTYYPHIGQMLNYLNWGLDVVDDGSINDAAKLVWHLNRVGIKAAKAYPGAASENHHIVLLTGAWQIWKVLFNQRRTHNSKAWATSTYKERTV